MLEYQKKMSNKEKEPKRDSGFSEKEMDLAMDKTGNINQVKPARNANASVAGGAKNIFDPKKKKKSGVILDSNIH